MSLAKLPNTAGKPAVFTGAMQFMDRVEELTTPVPMTAEHLAQKTYFEQGLHVDASVLQSVSVAPDSVLPSPPPEAATKHLSKQDFCINFWLPMAWAFFLMLIFFVIFQCVLDDSKKKSQPSVATTVSDARGEIANDTTADFIQWIKTSPSGKAMSTALGQTAVVDREGRPELVWSGVNSVTCHALVQDIYDAPSRRGVAAIIDGKSTQFSCAGPHHQIVLTPRI